MKHQQDIAEHMAFGTLLILLCVFAVLAIVLIYDKALAEEVAMVDQTKVMKKFTCSFSPEINIDDWVKRRTDRYVDEIEYFYDTNGDLKADVVMVYAIEGIGSAVGSNSVPVIHGTPKEIAIDYDFDGRSELIVVDRVGDGECKSYRSVKISQPKNGRIEPTFKKKGQA